MPEALAIQWEDGTAQPLATIVVVGLRQGRGLSCSATERTKSYYNALHMFEYWGAIYLSGSYRW